MGEEMGIDYARVGYYSREVAIHGEECRTSAGLADQSASSWGDSWLIGGFAATVSACPWREAQQELGAMIAGTGAELSMAAGRICGAEDTSLQAVRELQEDL